MAELYLFDGYNLLHAGPFADARELVDALASYVAVRGARGVVVFDGVGRGRGRAARSRCGSPLTPTRCSSGSRPSTGTRARVLLVTSDATVAAAAGANVAKLSSQTFFRDFQPAEHRDERPEGLAGKLDPETRARLERLRRGE